MKRTLYVLGMGLAVSVFVYAALRLAGISWGYYENRQALAEASSMYHDAQFPEMGSGQAAAAQTQMAVSAVFGDAVGTEREPLARFQPLLELNPEIAGWIQLGPIDYPVLQAGDNEKYLSRNVKGEESAAGSIFMDYRNVPADEQRHLILYGHRMKDGTMFGDLKHYVDKKYYDAHRYFRLDTLHASYVAEVFAAYYTTTDFYYLETDFPDDASFDAFVEKIQRQSLYPQDMELTAQDRIVTLSTCDYLLDPENGRLVVHARLKRLD